MQTSETYRFLIFGLTSFHSLPQREQAMAAELAHRGHRIDFIEIAPSVAGKMQAFVHRTFSPLGQDTGFKYAAVPPNLHIHTPPTLPTGFRNSLTPPADRSIFRSWFRREFAGHDFSDAIVIINIPLWWGNFIDRTLVSPRVLIYDICDALEVQSRFDRTLQRLRAGETLLKREVDLVTYSAAEMRQDVEQRFADTKTLFLPNAVGGDFIDAVQRIPRTANGDPSPHIGYIGATTGKWFDEELFLGLLKRFPTYRFSVIGPVENPFADRCRVHANVTLHGFVQHENLPDWLQRFDAAIIPFRHNAITRVVNPLKMYEYASAGLPVVARWTEELEHYAGHVYLARTASEFGDKLERAVTEDSASLRRERMHFAASNTWKVRCDRLLDHLHQHAATV